MENSIVFVDGLFVEKPREGTPDFVIGKLSFNVAQFIKFANDNVNAKGYINVDMLESKKGTYYGKLNTYVPVDQVESKPIGSTTDQVVEALNKKVEEDRTPLDEIPF